MEAVKKLEDAAPLELEDEETETEFKNGGFYY